MTDLPHTWDHATLGTFTYDYIGWARELELTAFNRFRYVWGGGQNAQPVVELCFNCEDPGDDSRPPEPSEACIQLANLILTNQHALSDLLLEAIWKDLNGLGPATGMWWPSATADGLDKRQRRRRVGCLPLARVQPSRNWKVLNRRPLLSPFAPRKHRER